MKRMGYIKVPRKLFASAEWAEKRRFGHIEAQLDLLLSACYVDRRVLHCASGDIVLGRGQLLTSMRALAERWGWSAATVLRYLRVLQRDSVDNIRVKIESTIEAGKTLITICNYDEWSSDTESDETPNETGNETPNETGSGCTTYCDSNNFGNSTAKNETPNETQNETQNETYILIKGKKKDKESSSSPSGARTREEGESPEETGDGGITACAQEANPVNTRTQPPKKVARKKPPRKGCAEKSPPEPLPDGTFEYIPVTAIAEYLTGEDVWLESLCMNKHLDKAYVEHKIREYAADVQNSGEVVKDKRDCKRHFNNWLRKSQQYEQNQRIVSHGRSTKNQPPSPDELARAVAEGISRAHTRQEWE